MAAYAPEPARWLIFDAEGLTDVDATGLAMLAELEAALAREHVELLVARMKAHVHARRTADELAESLGEDHFFPTVRPAVAHCARSTEPRR